MPVEDDEISKDVYDLTVTARANSNYETPFRFAHASMEVYDNDPPVLDISYSDWEIIEGESAGFRIYSGTILSEPIKINLRISEVGQFISELNIDFVTMNAGENSVGFEIPTEDDDEFELKGEIYAEILPGEGYLIDERYNIDWLYVRDNDDQKLGIEISALTDLVVEGESARFHNYCKQLYSNRTTG